MTNSLPGVTAEFRDSTSTVLSSSRLDAESPLNRIAWRLLQFSMLLIVVAWLCHRFFGGGDFFAIWLTAAAASAGWIGAARFLLLDTAIRKFWIVWLILALVPLILGGSSDVGLAAALVMTFTFLLFRRYKPYRHLTSGRRARVFFGGILVLVVLSVGWEFPSEPDLQGASGFGRQVVHYALGSLRLFWVFSLLNLFLRMRLHFLRLKPKIFVSWIFIATVPMVLLFIFAVVTVYGSLGTTRARGVHALLTEWVNLAHREPDPHGEFQVTFVYPPPHRAAAAIPAWFPHFQKILNQPAVDPSTPPTPELTAVHGESEESAGDEGRDEKVNGEEEEEEEEAGRKNYTISLGPKSDEESVPLVWTPTDTAGYFAIGSELWLLSIQGQGTENIHVVGRLLDEEFLNHLSQLTGTHVGVLSTSDTDTGGDEDWTYPRRFEADSTYAGVSLQGHYQIQDAAPDSAKGFFESALAFGGATFNVLRIGQDGFYTEEILLHLQVRPLDLGNEFIEGKQTLNQIFLILLGTIAGLFLILEIGALFFGLRITSGITSAVSVLHQGTKRLAKGDLGTRIQIPNEDEFGDLADSFNEMALAVQKGREEAVARERLERELQTAREIQERLLPHEQPSVPGFEITGASLPSRQVGGDYYDFLTQDDGRFGIAIGDVSGKGIPAALLMSNLQASLQGQVIHPSSVSEVVSRVNELLVRSTDPHMFATFFYGVLDSRTGTFTSTNAGHNPPILYRNDGEVVKLESGGIPLGWLPDQDYLQKVIELAPGDVIVLYTDGITEAVGPPDGEQVLAMSEEGEDPEEAAENPDNMFGEEQLIAIIEKSSRKSATGIKNAILSAVAAHTAGTPQSDDITLVIIKRRQDSRQEENLDP